MEPGSNDQQPKPAEAAPPAAQANAATAAPLALPTTWPGAFGAFKHSKQAVIKNLDMIVVFWLLDVVITLGLELILKQRVGQLASYLISPLFSAILTYLYIQGVRLQKSDFNTALNRGLKLWLNMFLLHLLIILALVASLVLLIIPFFFVAPRLVLAPYFLVDKDMGVLDAFKASWEASKGHVGKVYGIVGASIVMLLPIFTIVGILATIYLLIMYSAVFAVLYEFITKNAPATVAPAGPAADPVS